MIGIRNKAIDALRGLAVIFMMVFHVAVDLEDFYGYAVGYREGLWSVFNNLIAIMFITVSGYTAAMGLGNRGKALLRLLTSALLVSLATWFFDRAMVVRFGILHFLFMANLLFPLFKDLKTPVLLMLSAGLFLAGQWIQTLVTSTYWLLFLGAAPKGFQTFDYYPLLPWLSFFLIGIVSQRYVKINYAGKNSFVGCCAFLGRHALLVYLVHQPLFLLFLYVILGKI